MSIETFADSPLIERFVKEAGFELVEIYCVTARHTSATVYIKLSTAEDVMLFELKCRSSLNALAKKRYFTFAPVVTYDGDTRNFKEGVRL